MYCYHSLMHTHHLQVSNEIIARCCAAIKLSEVFSPNVANVTVILQQSITAGAQWKTLYKSTMEAVAKTSACPWDHDLSPIFAHMDAFVQRCSDLLEVCDAQLQFAGQRPLPVFGGTRGEETKQIILDIRASFRSRVQALAGRTYDILDVKITRWHDDFNVFKVAVKDLEELLIKATDHAIESVSCLKDRIMLIETLQVGFAQFQLRCCFLQPHLQGFVGLAPISQCF
jgi:dynein heavy chain, axonemal